MQEALSRLKAELKAALTAHYRILTDTVPDIYGYSLFTEDGVSSLGAVANRRSALTLDPSDDMYNYYRYLAVEWSEWDDFGLFDSVNPIVNELHEDKTVDFPMKRAAILRLCLDVMCELDTAGLFGPRTDERFVVICLSDSDDQIMMESAKLLNTPKAFEAYSGEF